MAKQILILERVNAPSDLSFNYALWATVPTARWPFYANVALVSAFKNISAGELQDLRDGKVTERVGFAFYPAGTTVAAIKADLIAKFNEFQAFVTSQNAYTQYGTSWDGTTWTAGGVA